MDRFVIERFVDGQMCAVEQVELPQRLLNDYDLDTMVGSMDPSQVFVRHQLDTKSGYYRNTDNKWTYGEYETAVNIIKSRLN